MSDDKRQKQMAEAEALLGDRLDQVGFAKGLFFGECFDNKLPPYPNLTGDDTTLRMVDQVRAFCREHVDAAQIDRQADIPRQVIDGLGKLGVLGACLPTECGGRGMSQTQYCCIIEALGGHCGSTALFVNAHHSIGPRALVLFGTRQQQQRWLPKLATGEWISAFALTEEQAGSDAANVQTRAVPTPDGAGYVLSGEKRYITNGAIAQVLTVMARTPIDKSPGRSGGDSAVTAFIVTPDMPGFEVIDPRMEKMGVRGTATAKLRFREMFVPNENVLGQLGKGLRVALTVLDFGRTTFGASCTGTAKYCLMRARRHAASRVQFGEKIGSFELVKEKLAYMEAGALAMESATMQTAALIDAGASEYMLETAMLKVFSTEVLWRIVNDTFQIHGGMAYFADEPFERLIRDARINTIGEGANDVLRAFIALVGMRDVGLELQGVLGALSNPISNLGRLGGFAARRIGRWLSPATVAVTSAELAPEAEQFAQLIRSFGAQIERLLRTYREDIVDRQYQLARVSEAATELYVCRCVLGRLDATVRAAKPHDVTHESTLRAGRYYLLTAGRRIRANLQNLWDNDDDATTSLADGMGGGSTHS